MKTQIEEIQWSWDHPVIQELLLKYYRDWLFSTAEEADEIIDEVLSLTSLKPSSAILDIGCGLGYHAISFARRGFNVKAFDPGDRYVEIANKNAQKLGLPIEICQMTCNDLEVNEDFDLAWAGSYCPGRLEPSELVGDFRKIFAALKPDSWFVSTVAGKARPSSSKKTRNWEEKEDCFVLEEEWTDETHCYENTLFVYPDEGRIIKVIESDRIYDVESIVPPLGEAGFVDIETYSDLITKEPATPGQHFAFRCKRPKS
jgi:SAM-dependent methyltransferase